jgi:hypothetical protein
MSQADDNFLICRNCRNWGQPWILDKKTVICEKKQDIRGKTYTSQHVACKHFVPIQGMLPEELQKMRLFVQTLSLTQQSYFAWALSQASLLLGLKDSEGRKLALGDQVTFRLGLYGHTGTVEGVDSQHKLAVIVNSPAFVNSSISLLASSLTKIDREKAKDLIKEFFPETKNKLEWHINSLLQEIALLRAKQNWTKEEYTSLVFYEQQLANLESRLKHDATLASI